MLRPLLAAAFLAALLASTASLASDRIVVEKAGFASPESIVHDVNADVCYVSNINGGIAKKDGNGFISKVAPDGRVIALKWIDGTTPNVTLHAPKGLAISGRILYIADIDTVRLFDLDSGAPIAGIPIPDATFLNGLAALPAGGVAGTDSAAG